MFKRVTTAVCMLTLFVWAYCSCECAAQTDIASEDSEPVAYAIDSFGREKLAQKGYTFELFALNDTWANTTGGAYRRASTLGNLYTMAEIDTQKAGWWDAGRIHFEGGVYIWTTSGPSGGRFSIFK